MPAINMTRFKQYLRHDVFQQYLSFPLHDSRHPLVEPHHPVLDGVTEAVGRVGIFVLVHLNSRTPHGIGHELTIEWVAVTIGIESWRHVARAQQLHIGCAGFYFL